MESTAPPEPVGSAPPFGHQGPGPGTSPTTAMGGRVLVLNATFEPINVCTVRRAVVLLLKDKAELIERGRLQLHSESSTIARPVVIRLITYVKVPRDAHRRKITRRAVLARDSWTCQYCGSRSNQTRTPSPSRNSATRSPRLRKSSIAIATRRLLQFQNSPSSRLN